MHQHTENADYDWPPNLDDDSEDELGEDQSSLHRKSEELLLDAGNATDVAIRVRTYYVCSSYHSVSNGYD